MEPIGTRLEGLSMHELSVALSLLELAEEEAARQGAGRVVALHVRLGPLSGVLKEALLSAFQLARCNWPLGSPELIIEEVPLTAYCPRCAQERRLETPSQLCCPACGESTPQIITGRELDLVALEVE
jgi:hydrogenase nickel incorporation protein HypA/HybF